MGIQVIHGIPGIFLIELPESWFIDPVCPLIISPDEGRKSSR